METSTLRGPYVERSFRIVAAAWSAMAVWAFLVWAPLVWGLPAGSAPAEEGSSMTDGGGEGPVLLVVQGRLKPGAEAVYQKYVEGTGPLMTRYGATVERVGGGVDGAGVTETWPINAVLRFPDRAAAEGFLNDPEYLEIKQKYRDEAYDVLRLSMLRPRPPRGPAASATAVQRSPEEVAREAFEHFLVGIGGGSWEGFLARLSDDFTLRFPTGRWRGTHKGKEKAAEFFDYFAKAFPQGLRLEGPPRVTSQGSTSLFEFTDQGLLFGEKPYRNHVAIALDVCGEKVCAYREYFGWIDG